MKLSTPAEWNELSRNQFIFYSKLVLRKIDIVHAKLLMVSYLMGARAWSKFKKLLDSEKHRFKRLLMKDVITLDRYNQMEEELNTQLYFLQNSVNFLWDDIKLTRWMIPYLKSSWFAKNYYGPTDEMRNSSFHEFAKADGHFIKYMQAKDPLELDLLISCLYRLQKPSVDNAAVDWNNDVREQFNEHTVASRARKFKGLHDYLKQAILTNYIGVRIFIVKKHPHVFIKDPNSKSEPDPYGLLKIIPSLGRITQNELIARSELYTVLYEMEMTEVDRIKAEAELEKMRKKNR